MSASQRVAYKIEILDLRSNHRRQNDVVFTNTQGVYLCVKCDWRGFRERSCPRCGNRQLIPQDRVKAVDMVAVGSKIKVGLFTDYKKALKWGRKFGTVISCQKIDKSYYLENIEHLNLRQDPLTLEVEPGFVLNKALELERPRRDDGKINIELAIDKDR